MSEVLVIIPARRGSKGIPNKNFRLLVGQSPVARAAAVSRALGYEAVLSTDATSVMGTQAQTTDEVIDVFTLPRPPALAQDDTPMIDVVRHVLDTLPGPDDQIIVLLQPTQPLRQPRHVQAAIALLTSSGATSVASVVEVPADLRPELLCELDTGDGQLNPWRWWCECGGGWDMLTRRQDAKPAYQRDGTVYAFYRRNVATVQTRRIGPSPARHFYGVDCRALIIPPEETCPLDTLEDWSEAERRLKARA